ncbi:hypothetical protein P4519_09910, partial [Geobacillus stearothermophilus]|uniref:hypothetical protein n=1 Tax=Geobacillus stearothermophilus TaxID=1422 RepID=UPI002E1A31AA|nr:hypothetical protein [Geobacillus stearothermophilus]
RFGSAPLVCGGTSSTKGWKMAIRKEEGRSPLVNRATFVTVATLRIFIAHYFTNFSNMAAPW